METAVETKAQEIEPGLYRDISLDEYLAWDAVNESLLNVFSRTPAHVYYEMTHGGKEPTKSMELGSLLHLAVLEPERFETSVVVPPKVDRRTRKGKEDWARFEAEAGDKQLVDIDVFTKVKAMANSVREHPTASEFYSRAGQNEISIVWAERETGIKCKARIDRVASIGEWPIIGDLKSAWNASRRLFEKAIYSYGYDVQAAHYLDGLDTLFPVPEGNPFRRFVFFVVESEPPFCTAVYELDDSALNEGALKRARYLRKWKECVETGVWAGYPSGIEYVSLPRWAFTEWVDE